MQSSSTLPDGMLTELKYESGQFKPLSVVPILHRDLVYLKEANSPFICESFNVGMF